MPREKDVYLLHHLRNNSRDTLTNISKKMEIPVTTVYDRLKVNEKKFVRRNTCLINFQNLGLNSVMYLAFKVSKNQIDEFEKFLNEHPNVNSAHKTDFENEYLLELISEDSSRANQFIMNAEKRFGIHKLHIYNVVKELQREAILTKPNHVKEFSTSV